MTKSSQKSKISRYLKNLFEAVPGPHFGFAAPQSRSRKKYFRLHNIAKKKSEPSTFLLNTYGTILLGLILVENQGPHKSYRTFLGIFQQYF
jgi:hypothetical protein